MSEIPEDKPKVVRHRRSLRGALAEPEGPHYPNDDALREAIERAWEIELRERYVPMEGSNQIICPKCGGDMDQGSIVSDFRYAPSIEQQKPFHSQVGLRIAVANACTDCGFLEFAIKPELLKNHLRG